MQISVQRLAKNWPRLAILWVAWAGLYSLNEILWDAFFFDLLQLNPISPWVMAAHFFCYDLIKILLLVAGITYLVTFLQTFVSVEKTRTWLAGRGWLTGHLLAALLGVITPFCSCSSVPLFIGFMRGGIPLGVTMTFLIASPLVSEIAVVLLFAYFGWQVAMLYVIAGVAISVAAGWLIEKLSLEDWVEPFARKSATAMPMHNLSIQERRTLTFRMSLAQSESIGIAQKVMPYLLVGLALGAVLHGWMPTELILAVAGPQNWFAVPMVVVLGIPLYGGGATVLPLIDVLSTAGVPIGTLLAMMMSVIALSIPEMILLKQVLKPKMLLLFAGIVALGITAVGYLFNLIL